MVKQIAVIILFLLVFPLTASAATSVNVIQNPGFESGKTIWVESSSDIIENDIGAGHNSSNWDAWLGGYNNASDSIYQNVTIPADAVSANLDFWVAIQSTEIITTPYDFLYVKVEDPPSSGNFTLIKTLSNQNISNYWQHFSNYDLTPYKGKTIRLYFAATTDATNSTNFFIDDVSLMVTAYNVISSYGKGGSISPSTTTTILSGETATYTITPDNGYIIVEPIGGTCPQGTLLNNSYTTGAITSDCTVEASFFLTQINGKCGSANEQVLVESPTTNLCSTGAASQILGNGPWQWTCAGQNNGSADSCMAYLSTQTHPANTNWQSIGPFGGSVLSLAIDPTNSQTVYAATHGGVFKSTNGGASWAGSLEMISMKVSFLAIDPANSQTIYAATDMGVCKTTNGGASWETADSGITDYEIESLAIAKSNSQIIYAGTWSGGIFKTTDGGISWNAVNNGLTNTNIIYDVRALAIDPTNSQMIYAATGDGVFKSINGGDAWAEITNNLLVWSFAIDPYNIQTVYAATTSGVYKTNNGGVSWIAVNNGLTFTSSLPTVTLAIDPMNSQTLYVATDEGMFFKSINGGASWTATNSELPSVLALAIDPFNSQTVYAGIWGGILKSTNGGVSWKATNDRMSNNTALSLVIDPSDSRTIYAGTVLGLYKTTNGGVLWTAANNEMTDTVTSLAIDPKNSQTIYAGTDHSGVYKTTDGGASWTLTKGGWIRSLAIDPSDSQTIYAGTDYGILKTTNGGATWNEVNNGFRANLYERDIRSIAIDSTNSQVIYAGTNGTGIFKSSDGGESWIAVNSGMTSEYLRSIAIDPKNSQTIYAATLQSGVFKSINSGASWTMMNNGMKSKTIYSLVIDPSNSQIIYAGTFYGVFKSTNGGASWITTSENLAYIDVYSLVIDPSNNQTIYAGTFGYGVYKSLFSYDVPVITSTLNASFAEGVFGSFQLATSGWPAPIFSLSGTLPSGLTFDPSTGTISGTPAAGTAGSYPLLITATNGIPPDAVRGFTLTVLPASTLAATISTPAKGAGLANLAAITGTATGSSLSRVELQIFDSSYYLQNNGTFSSTPAWLSASGTATWTFNTSSVTWREGVTYTVQARAVNSTTTSVPTTSTFTILPPAGKSATVLSMTINPDTLRAGDTAVISGSLFKTDTTAAAGQPVTLLITPPSTQATPFPSPIIQTVNTDTAGNFTTGNLSLFALPGVYMIQARFEGNATLASSFASQALGVTSQSGYAIIVTAKASDNSLLDLHTASTDTIYSTLVNKRGFLPENINYLKSSASAPVTRQQIQDAITIWAKNKLVAAPGPLYLIMIDHGNQSGFILDTDTLTPTQLKEYLDTLESDPQVIASGTLTAHNRIIMIGSCYSGKFNSLSNPGRVVITSASADEQSIAGFTIYNSGSNTTYFGGEYFIDSLFSYLGRGDSFKDAFLQSSSMVELRDSRRANPGMHSGIFDTLAQHPLLDDNGDGKLSYILDSDGALAASLYLGVGKRTLGNPADIIAVTETTTIPADQTTPTSLWLKVNDNSRIAKAWMEIRTPVINPPTNGGTGQYIPPLDTRPLYYDGIQWNGSYDFPQEGTYVILYYTQDNQTFDIAPAKSSMVYKKHSGTTSPTTFNLISPTNGLAISGIFPFTWEASSTPGVTYTLMVATDQNISSVVYKKEKISYPVTQITTDELKDPKTSSYYCSAGHNTYCYWKIQALDAFGTIIQESLPWTFTISDTNQLQYNLTGKVISAATGLQLNAVNITVTGNGITYPPTDNTKADGSYGLALGYPGEYTVTLSYPKYQTRNEIVTLATPGTTTRNFILAVATEPINGQCGDAINYTYTDAPAVNFCAEGNLSEVNGTGPWSWACNGLNGGTLASCSAQRPPWPLTTLFAGTGGGSVNGGISCTSGSACPSVAFTPGTNLTLIPTPNTVSTFGGWSGACTNATGNCSLTMNSAKSVTATFIAAAKVKIGTKDFTTLQAAYDDTATTNGSVIKLLEGALANTLTAGRGISMKLEGGYNATYSGISSETVIQGPVKVRAGTIRMKSMKVR